MHTVSRRRHGLMPPAEYGSRCSATGVTDAATEMDTRLTQRMFEKMNAAAETKQGGSRKLARWCIDSCFRLDFFDKCSI